MSTPVPASPFGEPTLENFAATFRELVETQPQYTDRRLANEISSLAEDQSKRAALGIEWPCGYITANTLRNWKNGANLPSVALIYEFRSALAVLGVPPDAHAAWLEWIEQVRQEEARHRAQEKYGLSEPVPSEPAVHAIDSQQGRKFARRRLTVVAGVALFVLATAICYLALGRPGLTYVARPTPSPLTTGPSGASVTDPRAPRADRYACTPPPPTQKALPATLRADQLMYAVDSSGAGATPLQVDPGGYLDQAFVATAPEVGSVAAVLAVPAPSSLPTPDTTIPAVYELWNLRDAAPMASVRVEVGQENGNEPVDGVFDQVVRVEVGQVYFLRVIYPPPAPDERPAQPSLAVYLRSQRGQFAPLSIPVCVADREPSRASPPVLESQRLVLSGNVRPP